MPKKYRIPSIGALVAFESAARLLNFSQAAKELHVAQSAVSRYISELEKRLEVRLFVRPEASRKGMTLSHQGEQFYRYVESALNNLQTGINLVQSTAANDELVIACTHEISHLYLMPRYDMLQTTIGENIRIRLVTSDYESMSKSSDARIDIMFAYNNPYREHNRERYATIYKEGIKPVCSPDYLETHDKTLSLPPNYWGEVTFLRMAKFDPGWASWEDWFATIEPIEFTPNYVDFDNYVYLLEAAATGRGVALGWRGLIERYIDSSTLVAITDDFVNLDRKLYAIQTDKGISNPAASKCLAFFRAIGPAE